ncbi:MAG TPA: endoglucanase [Desulfobacterales bacterium]|nr:endoglucanase [Desulfobacterales bacterium]
MPDLRRLLLCFLLLWPGLVFGAETGTWQDYKTRFVAPDGRIIDNRRGDISHSEGQGYGMLLALIHEDRESFETIRRWTVDNLQVRKDGLFAWSWGQRSDESWAVIDYNNATDGDLLIGSALVQAGKRWQRSDYRDQGRAIANEIQRLLTIRVDGKTLLLPGYWGFNSSKGLVINLSYFVFPAFRAFAEIGDRAFWSAVERDALGVLQTGLRGSLKLPPDWLILSDGRLTVFEEKSECFGYEAIRVPLYLAMANLPGPAEPFRSFLMWVKQHGYLPVNVDIIRETVTLADSPAGFYTVMGRCAALLKEPALSNELFQRATQKLSNEPQDYYSYTLYLLARNGDMP